MWVIDPEHSYFMGSFVQWNKAESMCLPDVSSLEWHKDGLQFIKKQCFKNQRKW